MGWGPPTDEEVKKASAELTWILKLATQIKKGGIDESVYHIASKAEVDKAREYIERFPDAVD